MKLVSEPAIFSNKLFTLRILQSKSDTIIKMLVLTSTINTSKLPHTSEMLGNILPSIFTHLCFNNQNSPFREEVKKTEIGHLFEHILLEYLSQLKNTKEGERFVVEGKTRWDWQTEKVGIFHIKVNVGISDDKILFQALEKSISLLKQIIRPGKVKKSLFQSILPLNS